MGWFGQNSDEVWQQLSEQIGAEFVSGGFWRRGKVNATVGPWTVTLDTHTVSTGHTHVTYTRLRAPYVNPESFRFTIYRSGFFTPIGKLFGVQDIAIGDDEFDAAFVVQGNDEARVHALLDNREVRRLLAQQPQVRFQVKDREGWFGPKFPPDVDELHFQVVGVIKDLDVLKGLFQLFAVVLDQLCRMGSAYKQDPEVTL